MPLHHDHNAPSIISTGGSRRSPRRHSGSLVSGHGRTSGSLVSGHGRTSGSSLVGSEHPHSHSHHTQDHSGSPVYGSSPPYMQSKPNFVDRLAHGPAARPIPQHQQSFSAETTAATCEGPTSFVPPRQRGYAAPPPQPVVHRVQNVPTVGDRIHGAAKKMVGTVMLDRNKRSEGRAMELGIPVQSGQSVMGHTVAPSVTSSSGRARRSGVRYHY